LLDRSSTLYICPPAAEGVRFPLYAMWRKRLIQQDMPACREFAPSLSAKERDRQFMYFAISCGSIVSLLLSDCDFPCAVLYR